MRLDLLLTPKEITPAFPLHRRAVVVFDVLRATTTMIAALAAGVAEIRIFDSVESAAAARAASPSAAAHPAPVLCGERGCLPPPGFDLGNSPGAFSPQLHAGRTLFMSTTNGTRAIVAARAARLLLAGALVNAAAVAQHLAAASLDVLLLCAGTDGAPALEDLLGAGAVIDALQSHTPLQFDSDLPLTAWRAFLGSRADLPTALAQTTGARNVIAAGLSADIAFAARLNSLTPVGQIHDHPLRLVPARR